MAFWGPLAASFGASLLGGKLSGGGDPGSSGAFPGAGELGKELQRLLLERVGQQPADTESFKFGSKAIRDALSGATATARQRLGDRATTGGYLDSGAVSSGLVDIDRAGSEAYAQQITQLLLGLEDRRLQGVLPFLQGASDEHMGRAGVGTQASGQTMDFASNIFSTYANTAGGTCWVAAAAYNGWDDPRTHAARRWILTKAPDWLRIAYQRYGPDLAPIVGQSEVLRARVRRFFDGVTN